MDAEDSRRAMYAHWNRVNVGTGPPTPSSALTSEATRSSLSSNTSNAGPAPDDMQYGKPPRERQDISFASQTYGGEHLDQGHTEKAVEAWRINVQPM